MREIFGDQPNLKPYSAIKPEQTLDEINPEQTAYAKASEKLDLDEVDRADMNLFNRILWSEIKGANVLYPTTKKMSSLEAARAR